MNSNLPEQSESITHGQTEARDDLKHYVKSELRKMIAQLKRGDRLPSYRKLATRLHCSLAPVGAAMGELHKEGWISLQRGRAAKVLWNNSFTESAHSAGRTVTTNAVELGYRTLTDHEAGVAEALELTSGDRCLICFRVRRVDGRPLAYQRTYVNPRFFTTPERFFVDHDVINGSLSGVYADAGFRALRVVATLRVGEADELEQNLLSLLTGSPVLRSFQKTIIEYQGEAGVLEVMHATYARDIEYTVERLPGWNQE